MVGLSGGVDSSLTAWRLREQGRQVGTLFMKNWEEDDASGICPAEADAADARAVAAQLGLPFFARNFATEYWDGVFAHFLSELQAGRTPNPDVLCNREVKFKTFVEHAADLGYACIATGHYAQKHVDTNGIHHLLRAHDDNKDQTYFLHAISQAQLAVVEFPIGDLDKPQVRMLAERAGLLTSGKKDSTGICFIGERNFPQFIRRYLTPVAGPILRVDDAVEVGRHEGLIFHTLGQRGGLHIGGRRDSNGQPWFVAGKDMQSHILWAVQGDHPALYCLNVLSEAANWITGTAPAVEFSCTAKTRYRQSDQDCKVVVGADGCLSITFAQAQRAVTPGQSVVLYQDNECLGGAVIAATDARFGGLEPA
jgi:tRNA-specific 2-thiouridylase